MGKKKQIRPDQNAIRERVTKAMVEALGKGTPPWRQPWSGGVGLSCPLNFRSKRFYQGINPLLLLISAEVNGFSSPHWGTAAAWEKHVGASPCKWEEPTRVVFFTLVPVMENGKKKKSPKGKDIFFPLMREYPLFNAEQIRAITPKSQKKLAKLLVMPSVHNDEPDFDPAEAVIRASGAKIVHKGQKACYQREPQDRIMLPAKRSFDSMGAYYETTFHELMHWTEASGRVGQKKGHDYAFGELVAEIGSCMILLMLGVPMADKMLEHSQSYVKSWMKSMGDNPRYIFDAATQANKGVSYILKLAKKAEKTQKVQQVA